MLVAVQREIVSETELPHYSCMQVEKLVPSPKVFSSEDVGVENLAEYAEFLHCFLMSAEKLAVRPGFLPNTVRTVGVENLAEYAEFLHCFLRREKAVKGRKDHVGKKISFRGHRAGVRKRKILAVRMRYFQKVDDWKKRKMN